MQRIRSIALVALSGVGLVVLVFIMNGLFQSQVAAIAARRTPTAIAQATTLPRSGKPTPKPTKQSKVTWKNTTLDRITFGEEQSIFTNNSKIKVYQWLPDNKRVLLEIEDPHPQDPYLPYRIVTLNVQTGEIVEFGRREESIYSPIWLPQANGVAFLTIHWWQNEPPNLMLGLAQNLVQQLDVGYNSPSLDFKTGNLLYLKEEAPENTLREYDAVQKSFVATGVRGENLPWGQLRADPKGNWLASFRGRLSQGPLYLANRNTGNIATIEFKEPSKVEPQAWWPLDAIWSHNGKKLALMLANGAPNISMMQLALLNPKTADWKIIKLPAQFLTELAWAPGNRFLLARGVPTGYHMSDEYAFWLVDTKDGAYKDLSYFPPNRFSTYPFMTWSSNGKLAWLRTEGSGFTLVNTQVEPTR